MKKTQTPEEFQASLAMNLSQQSRSFRVESPINFDAPTDARDTPRATIVFRDTESGLYHIGLSVQHPDDSFDRRRGQAIAESRLNNRPMIIGKNFLRSLTEPNGGRIYGTDPTRRGFLEVKLQDPASSFNLRIRALEEAAYLLFTWERMPKNLQATFSDLDGFFAAHRRTR